MRTASTLATAAFAASTAAANGRDYGIACAYCGSYAVRTGPAKPPRDGMTFCLCDDCNRHWYEDEA
jgi:hypothetical protein